MPKVSPSRLFEILLIYFAGLLQGIVIVTPPAAGNLLTSSSYQGLSTSQYGALFLPLIIGAILASFLGGLAAKQWSLKGVLLLGLLFNALSMALLSGSSLFLQQQNEDYSLLLVGMGCLGIGFGGTLTTLNTYVAEFFPERIPVAMSALHSLLGLGTALAPLLLQLFIFWGAWWGAPLLISLLFVLLILLSVLANLRVALVSKGVKISAQHPMRSTLFWVFVCIGLLYGFSETVFGNWSTIFMHQSEGISMEQANFALSTMWALVTIGRIIIAIGSVWVSPRWTYLTLTILIVIALFSMSAITGPGTAIFIMALAGIACSGMLPLTVSFGTMNFPSMKEVISGIIVSAYMLGYGIASYGIGELLKDQILSLTHLYHWAMIPAVVTIVFAGIATFQRQRARRAL
jgi:fucose permease